MSRIVAATLLCITIGGCASSGVCTPLPSGGLTTFLVYAPPSSELGVTIDFPSGVSTFFFARDSSYDNHTDRPDDIPASYVAFTVKVTLGSGTYDADLVSNDGTPAAPIGKSLDTIDRFPANTLVLIDRD